MAFRSGSLTPKEVPQVYDLLERSRRSLPQGHLAAWTEDQILKQIQAGPTWSIWSVPSGELQAFVLGQRVLGSDPAAGEGVEVLIVLVEARLRGAALGLELMKGLHRECPDAAFWRLEVHENNTSARQFYARLGFAPVGFRPRYYPDGGSAVLLDVDGKELAARLGV